MTPRLAGFKRTSGSRVGPLLMFVAFLTSSLLWAAPPPAPTLQDPIPDTFTHVDHVVAIGDIHGDLEALRDVLRLSGLTDSTGKWIGGKTHLVQTGDITDRGPSSRAVMDTLMRLQAEAARAGGKVHVLLGNHEVMNMTGDLRYVSPPDLLSFANLAPSSGDAQHDALVGHKIGYSLEGVYGRWLRQLPAAIRIDGSLFVHGGIARSVPSRSLTELNHWVRQDLFPGNPPGGAVSRNGPLWYRGYAEEEETTLLPDLEEVLQRFGASRMVIGHTVTKGQITTRFQRRLVQIDTGMSSSYGGHRAALEIRGTRLEALYPNARAVLVEGAAVPSPRESPGAKPAGK